jgi:beta-lactamase class A
MKRRQFTHALGLFTAAYASGGCAQEVLAPFQQKVRQIEARSGGRLGVAVLDSHTGALHSYRGDERFPMCSTFKLLAAALVLARVDQGRERLDRRVQVRAEDILEYAPVTQPRVGGAPMTVAELCEAAITLSDNTAANLLLRSFGGPEGLTAYVRTLGDDKTRLDRIEPDLNEATPGDPRDTTTPAAMLGTLRKIVLGDALSPNSKEQMTQWLLANKTGDKCLRALLPADWRVGDKTGSGAHGTRNDIGVLWPPGGRAPLLVCAYLTGSTADAAARDRALAEVGQLASTLF